MSGEERECHCGRPVRFGFDGDPTHHRGMCADCDEVRCDAYPQECPWRHFPAPGTGADVEVLLSEHHWGDDTAMVGHHAMQCGCGWKDNDANIYALRARHDQHRAEALSDWLAAHDAATAERVRRETAEGIAAAIEGAPDMTFRSSLDRTIAADIAYAAREQAR